MLYGTSPMGVFEKRASDIICFSHALLAYLRTCYTHFFLNNLQIVYACIFLYEIYLVLDIINQSFLEINTSNTNRKSL